MITNIKKMLIGLSLLVIYCSGASAFVIDKDGNHNDPNYFDIFKKLNHVPANYIPSKVLGKAATNQLYYFLKTNQIEPLGKENPIQGIADNGQLISDRFDSVKIYSGNFDNTGRKELAFVACGGSAHDCLYYFYSKTKNNLIPINFDKVVNENFNTDMLNFYWWTANPFVIKKNNKTYLRFMEGPGGHMDYDSNALLVCTYYWKDRKIKLIREDKKNTSTKHCML